MQPLKELTNGLEILEPFLKHYGFLFDNYENGKVPADNLQWQHTKMDSRNLL
jgi:hypothetical protein